MARFTRNNNPRKKRIVRKPDYTDRCINAGKSMLIDYKLGYNPIPRKEEGRS